VIIAGGLMAGGALGGVFGAALRILPKFKENWIQTPFYNNVPVSETVSLVAFLALCCYVYFSSLAKPKETE
jgi:hypothetical protein